MQRLGSHEEQTDARCRVDDGHLAGSDEVQFAGKNKHLVVADFNRCPSNHLFAVDVRMVGRTHVFNDEVFGGRVDGQDAVFPRDSADGLVVESR